MTMMLTIKDKYVKQLENFVNSLPEDAIEVKNSLDAEISQRVQDYRSEREKSMTFDSGLDVIREKLSSQI